MKKRNERQEMIRKVVSENPIKTQKDLVSYLEKAGFPCTQTMISRDIEDLGLIKAQNGCYTLPEWERLRRMVYEFVEDATCAGHMVVVKTFAGSAGGVCAAIDDACLEGVLGSVAGDDTIFCVAASQEDAQGLREVLSTLMRK
ncbi:MAG: ArgR family transcriptional regulator [Eggerthellaceae bacterium]|nr:ArgR family transcriptional regulator [Eggerthellaceae bacterium]